MNNPRMERVQCMPELISAAVARPAGLAEDLCLFFSSVFMSLHPERMCGLVGALRLCARVLYVAAPPR